jgi:BolA protein
MNRHDRIKEILQQFDPIECLVENQSALHHGHAGDDGSGESHFSVYLVAETFRGQSRVTRQRRVMQALGPEWAGGLHAVTFTLLAPGEAARSSQPLD